MLFIKASKILAVSIVFLPLTGCAIAVCINRVAAVECLAEQGVQVVISDDGLQHYRMRRSLELVVIEDEIVSLIRAGSKPLEFNEEKVTHRSSECINPPLFDCRVYYIFFANIPLS